MQHVRKEKGAGFTKRISTNDILPRDSSQPLTVIEFSLVPQIKESLKKAIDEFRATDYDDEVLSNEALAKIIQDHFPPEVLTELRTLAEKNEHANTVYVVNNLPMVPKEKMSGNRQERKEWKEQRLKQQRDYAFYIGKAVGLAVGLKHVENFKLSRFNNQATGIVGANLHNHTGISVLSGVMSLDRAPTGFTDWHAMLQDAAAGEISPMPTVSIDDGKPPVSLNELTPEYTDLHPAGEITIIPHDHKAVFHELENRHSQKIIARPGSLIIWPEDGRIYHRAWPGNPTSRAGKNAIVREVWGHEFSRPVSGR